MSNETEVQAGGQIPDTPAPDEGTLLGTPENVPEAEPTNKQVEAAPEAEVQTDEDAKAKEGAPEAYEFKVPEGMTLDQKVVEEFTPLAKELGLSQENAQKMVDLYASQVQKFHQAQLDNWRNTLDEWASSVKADKEIGGENYDTSVRHARAAIQKFGGQELRDVLNASGMGANPELVRVFARIGKAMAEDQIVLGGKESGPTDVAKILYPSMN